MFFSLSLSLFSPYLSSGAVFPSPPLQTPSLGHLEALHPKWYWDYRIPMLFLVVSLSSWLHRSTESWNAKSPCTDSTAISCSVYVPLWEVGRALLQPLASSASLAPSPQFMEIESWNDIIRSSPGWNAGCHCLLPLRARHATDSLIALDFWPICVPHWPYFWAYVLFFIIINRSMSHGKSMRKMS